MAVTVQPTARSGEFDLIDDQGKVVGGGVARASSTYPGYVILVASSPLGNAVRVPADWIQKLGELT